MARTWTGGLVPLVATLAATLLVLLSLVRPSFPAGATEAGDELESVAEASPPGAFVAEGFRMHF